MCAFSIKDYKAWILKSGLTLIRDYTWTEYVSYDTDQCIQSDLDQFSPGLK